MEHPFIMRRLMLIILTLGVVSGQDIYLKYLMAAPAVLPYPSNQTVCVYVISPDVDVTLKTSLTAQTASTNFITQINKGDGQLYCNTFQVPSPTNGEDEIATVAIDITIGDQKQSEQKSVIISPIRNGIFTQTDRAIYQPGDKMIMNAVDFNENLIAKNEPFTLVTLQDDQNNIIKQWQSVQPKSGILEISYNLSPDIRVGEYTITVNKGDSKSNLVITVEKYVLPKFEVKIDAPDEVTIHERSLSINILGTYLYGQPVRGHITGKMCRNALFSADHICKPIDGQTDVNGRFTAQEDTDLFKFKHNGYMNNVDVEASLEEDGTGVQRKDAKSIVITDILAKVEFMESRAVFKLGIDYRGQMVLRGPDGLPMVGEDIELYVDEERRNEIYTTDKYGMARFTLEATTLSNKVINLRAQYLPRQPRTAPVDSEVQPVYEDGYASLIPSHTISVSQVKIRNEPFVLPCNERVNLWADYVLDPSEHTKETIDFHYLIITFGRIVSSSSIRHTISPDGGLRSFFPIPVMVNSDMSPAATILIYAGLEYGNLIADSLKIPVTSCFPNTVSLKFSEEQSLPGSMVNLHISAHPNSMCSVRAVDKSGKLLKSEERRSEDNVNKFLKEWDTEGYPIEIEELQECPPGSSPVFVEASEQPDIFSIFEHCGIKTLTNFAIRKPLECESQGPEILQNFAKSKMVFPRVKKDAPPQENVRRRFPTTWIMNLMLIGSTGELDYPVKTPDTITQWNVEAFCTSTIGLGFSPQTYLQVFKPFSLEMITPYSVKQGETFVLKANVLNSMRRCMKVQATLYQSKDFQVEPCEGCLYNACLCSEPTYTFTWTIISLTLGSINISVGIEALSTSDLCDGQKPMVPKRVQSDIVQRRLIIEQNGVPEKKTHSILLCAFELDTILLDLPENVVLGSQSAKVTVTGDIMGKPLDNLNNLVLLPFGCGEQNMMLLGPMIAVINYYSTTGQLTDEIVAKATEFMETGLQNQLNYKHTDGSYSAFGNSDPSGSTWLTAFVARIFFMGLKYIHIEYRHITEALDWLKGQQQSNGCFKSVGQIFPKERQTGEEDNMITLTAFVSLTFLEVGDPQYDEVVEKSKQCLEKCTDAQSSTYTKAQCAYAYTLMGDTEKRTQLLEQLDQVAIKKDDMTHWSQNSEIPSDDPLRSKPNSGNVETTAYVVLAMVSGTNPTETDLGAAVPAIRWLNSQQNSNGGFTSTQDTVVAIFAMSKYGSLTFVDENMPTVTITNDKGFSENVTVNPQNPTEVKVVDLPDIPAEYTLEASGSGCAYVQIIIGYNILNPEPEKSFMLDAVTSAIECPPHPAPKFSIGISFSLSDAREDEASNMVIIIVKMVSGFVPVKRSVNALLANSVVKKVKSSPADVMIYLEKIDRNTIQLSIDVEQQSEVKDLQPAVICLKDYETSRRIEVTYQSPCK